MASGSSSDAGNVGPWPASILLAEQGYISASRNDTTAIARWKDNYTMEITFWIADPPAVSFYTFRCIKAGPNSDSKDVDLRVHSVVAGAHGRFLLLRTRLAEDNQHEFFVYKGHPESPSLESIPLVPFECSLKAAEFGIVPRGDDGHYLLIALQLTVNEDYQLYIYSSEDRTWTTKELPNPCPEAGTIIPPDKVFTLGDGLVLFVDLLKGILTCDVLKEPLRAQYIPLPEPLPGNRESVKKYDPGVRLFRDLTCVDGLIKFAEIENRVIIRKIIDVPPEEPSDPRTKDVLSDSELIMLRMQIPVENKPRIERSMDGWSAIIWTREIGSNFWLKGNVVDVNDILVDDSASVSSNKSESAGSMTFNNLECAYWPTLSTDGNDILYLKLSLRGVPVLASVDLVEKTLKVDEPGVRTFGKYVPLQKILRPCALAHSLKITPAIKASASQIALMDSSAKKPNSTAIRVGEPISYESENKRPRLLAEKVNHALSGSQSTAQNGESTINHAISGSQSTAQNGESTIFAGCPPCDAAPSAMASGSSNDAGNVGPWPASILLAEQGYVSASRNDTTARARWKDSHTVEITFWIADPPAVSFYTSRCTKAGPNSDSKDVDLRFRSVVAGAHGRFVLFRTLLGRSQKGYFIYKGHPESPSLESIPDFPYNDSLNAVEFGIVPLGDDGHYLLIALRDTKVDDYRLHIYSSQAKEWRTEKLPNPCPGLSAIMPDKAFTLGDGSVLWVDLLLGMLKCDVLQQPLRAQYIPLPEPLPGNREKVKKCLPGVKFFRDVTCVDGLIKFVEIEHRVIVREIAADVPPEKPSDPRTKDVFYDSELIRLSKRKPVENKPKMQHSEDGWSAIIWTRKIGSNCWLKGSVVDVNDILVDDSVFSALLSSNKSETAGSLTFKNLKTLWPTLSMDGNDILYLKSSSPPFCVWALIAVDLVEKTLKVEVPGVHPVEKYNTSRQTLRPCALANQLKMTPGIKVSASPISRLGSSANEPNSTAIRVAEANFKRPRPLARNVNHAQNGAQSTVQNALISQVHPNQNNMPPRLCFNRYEQPGYSGYSSWPHQNIPPPLPPPPSCFNRWSEPYNPVYAPSVPAPNIQSYVNYQSLPHQPLLQGQQTTPSMAFGPHMAHPINNWYGAAPTIGFGSSINPYAYGAHSGTGVYHQR